MTNKDLINAVALKTALSKRATEQLLRTTSQIIAQTLQEGGNVKIQHFGTLEVRQHQPRKVTNPRTGNSIVVPAKQVWTFKMNDHMKETINSNI